MLNKFITLQISTIVALAVAGFLAYYFLLQDNFLHISISSIIQYSHQLAVHKHMLVLGLLPIYIALMVFGAAVLGIYLGSAVQDLLHKATRNKEQSAQKTVN